MYSGTDEVRSGQEQIPPGPGPVLDVVLAGRPALERAELRRVLAEPPLPLLVREFVVRLVQVDGDDERGHPGLQDAVAPSPPDSALARPPAAVRSRSLTVPCRLAVSSVPSFPVSCLTRPPFSPRGS